MNMISTGAFLNEMDASNKQEAISEKFVRAWEKKNAKAARAGGVSLMALSLAACGGSSSTTTTTTDTSTTTTTPVVVAGKSFALTSSGDVIAPNSSTAANTSTAGDDTFRAATTGDFTSADIIDGGDGADTLTANVTEGVTNSAVTIKPALTSVETVKITMTATANDTDTTLDLTDSTGVTSVEIVVANDADNVVTGITTATGTTWTGVGTADTVATVTLSSLSTATDGGADAYTTNLNNADLADLAIAGVENITLNLSGKDVDVADLSADALEQLIITGGVNDAAVTTENAVIGSGTAVDFAGLDTGEKAIIDASGSTNKVTVNTNDDDDLVVTGGAGALTIDNTADNGGDESDSEVTITAGAGGIAATIQGGGNTATTAMNLVTITGSDAADTVNIAAVVNPTNVTSTSADESKTVNAIVKTGAGNDTITIDAGVVDIDAGAGDDTLVVTTTSAITGGATAAVDLIDLGAGTDTISTSDATINASDKTWVSYIKNSEALKVTAAAEKTVDLDLLANTNITALTASAHTASNAAATTDAGGTGATGTGSVGGDALDFTGSNANSTITISAALTGQAGQGLAATSDDAGDTGGAGGVGLDLNATLDNGSNRATITLVDNADITGGAGGKADHANATGGNGGIGLDANEIDELNIVLSATDTTADTVTIAGGAAGAATNGNGTGNAGSAGGDISVAANATITITEAISGTATATTVSAIDLSAVVGTNVTINAGSLTGAVTIDSLQGNTTVTLGSAADTFGGAENGVDTVDMGAGDDTVNHTGGAVDVITLGAGQDTIKVGSAYDNSSDAFKVTDFARGTGGDIISIDVSVVDGATAALVDNLDITGGLYVEGSVGTVGVNDSATAFATNSVNVILGSSFATYAAVETELGIENGGTALTDIAVLFLNSTSGVAEMYFSDTTADATNDFLVASFTDVTTLDQLAEFAVGNFSEF